MDFREDQLVKTSTNRPGRSTIYWPLTKRSFSGAPACSCSRSPKSTPMLNTTEAVAPISRTANSGSCEWSVSSAQQGQQSPGQV